MKRREFIGLLGTAVMSPLAAQEAKMHKIGLPTRKTDASVSTQVLARADEVIE